MGRVAFDKLEARRGLLISGTPAGYAPDSSKFLQAADTDGNARWVNLYGGDGMYQGAGTLGGSNYYELGVQYPVWQVKAASTPGAPSLASASGAQIAIYGSVVDGVTLAAGDVILLKDFTDAPERNGVWYVNALNAPFAGATQLVRLNGVESAYKLARVTVAVRSGTAGAGTVWVANVDSGGVIDNTPVNFVTAKAATGTGTGPSATPVSQFRSTLAVNQSLATPGANIMWPVEEVDTDNWHSTTVNPDRITVDRPGRYLVTCSVSWATSTAGVRNPTLLKNNTVNLAAEADPAPGSVDNVRQNLATVVDLVAGDFLTVQGYHAAGAALNVIAGYTAISVTRLPDSVPTVPTALGAFSAYRATTQQTITASTWTKVIFETEAFDTSNWYDPATGRFTPQQAGVYRFNAQLYAASQGWVGQVALYKNGALEKTLDDAGGSADAYMGGGCLVSMNGSTDYVEVFVYQTTVRNVWYGAGQTYFQGEYIGLATVPTDAGQWVVPSFFANWRTLSNDTTTYGVRARKEGADTVRLSGIVERSGASFSFTDSTNRMFQVPAALVPVKSAIFPVWGQDSLGNKAIYRMVVGGATSGAAGIAYIDQGLTGSSANGASGSYIILDGLTYPLS